MIFLLISTVLVFKYWFWNKNFHKKISFNNIYATSTSLEWIGLETNDEFGMKRKNESEVEINSYSPFRFIPNHFIPVDVHKNKMG